MRKLLFLFSSAFFLLSSCSRNDKEIVPLVTIDPEAQLSHTWDLYAKHLSSESDSALYYSKEMQRIAKESGNSIWLATANEAIAHLHYEKGYLADAAYNYFVAANIYEDSGSLLKLANVCNSLGAIYAVAGDLKSSVNYYAKARDIFFYVGNSSKKAKVCINLAIAYKDLELYVEAQEMLDKAMVNVIEANDLSLISDVHNIQGIIYWKQGMNEMARESYFLSITNSDSLSNFLIIQAAAFNNIGETYLEEGNLKNAEDYFNQAISLKKKMKDPLFLQSSLNNLAEIQMQKGNYEAVVELLEKNLKGVALDHVVDEEVGKGLSLIIEAVVKLSEGENQEKRNFYIEKLSVFSSKLILYNRNLLEVRDRIEKTSKQQSLKLAEEVYSLGEELEVAHNENKDIKYAFIIPVLFFISALVSVYFTVKKNRKLNKVLGGIDNVLKGSLRRRFED